jgi:hypothetical protein
MRATAARAGTRTSDSSRWWPTSITSLDEGYGFPLQFALVSDPSQDGEPCWCRGVGVGFKPGDFEVTKPFDFADLTVDPACVARPVHEQESLRAEPLSLAVQERARLLQGGDNGGFGRQTSRLASRQRLSLSRWRSQ